MERGIVLQFVIYNIYLKVIQNKKNIIVVTWIPEYFNLFKFSVVYGFRRKKM